MIFPTFLVTITIILFLILDHLYPIKYQSNYLIFPTILLLIFFYLNIRKIKILSEIALFSSFWILESIYATKLTYISNQINFPLQDKLFQKLDFFLNFNSSSLENFIFSKPYLTYILYQSYYSINWSIFLTIVILSFLQKENEKENRNQILFSQMVICLFITITISTFLPALGTLKSSNYSSPSIQIINILRNNYSNTPLFLTGIISFPSFHTILAILLINSHKKLITFYPFLILNILVIFSTPTFGDHYLTDILGGVFISILIIKLTPFFIKDLSNLNFIKPSFQRI